MDMDESTLRMRGKTTDELHRRCYELRRRGLDFSEYQEALEKIQHSDVTLAEIEDVAAWVREKPFYENAEEIFDYYHDLEKKVLHRFLLKLLERAGEEFLDLQTILEKGREVTRNAEKDAIAKIKALKKEVDDVSK